MVVRIWKKKMYKHKLDRGSFEVDDVVYWYHAEYPKATVVRDDNATAIFIDNKALVTDWKEKLVELIKENALIFIPMEIKNLDLSSLIDIVNVKYISDDLRNEVGIEIKRREE